MSALLFSIGAWAFAARRLVVGGWLVAMVVIIGVAAIVSPGPNNTYDFPGTESQDALDALGRTFPQFSGTSAQLVAVAPPGGDVTSSEFEAAVDDTITSVGSVPQVSGVTSPYDSGSSGNIAPDSSAVLVPIQLTVGAADVLPSTSDALQEEGRSLQATLPAGSTVAVGGQLYSQVDPGVGASEVASLGIALIVLLITFGALAAAGMPLVTAIVGVGVSVGIVLGATRYLTITSTAPLLAVMLGLAVGVDYALFIISRHRDQLREGMSPEVSAPRAVATAGSAVVFAATTVIIALLGLSVTRIPFLTITGVAAALTVGFAALVTLTLTPALLGFAGEKVLPRRARHGSASDTPAPDGDGPDEASGGGFFFHWVRVVTRVPLATVVIVIGLLLLAAAPARDLRLTLPDAGTLPDDSPGRVTYDLIAEHFGPGFNGPLLLTGSVIQSTDPVDLVQDLADDIAATPGVASVPVATPNQSGDTAVIQVIPEGAPDSEQTATLVKTLRAQEPRYLDDYAVELSVTGYTALGIDISDRLSSSAIPFGLLVVGLSLVLLMMVFRSVVVPVTAALGYALSITAALGIISRVFMDGRLAGPLEVAQLGSVTSFAPIIIMGVLFGLAMDYEVFLVSRMQEDYARHGDPRGAIERGFQASAGVVTPAAIIMITVFGAFIRGGEASMQPIALGLAVGVAIDAFVVRMVLIPAVLVLFGDRSWWLPGWLDRLLPQVDVEGQGLERQDELADWPQPNPAVAIALEGVRTAGMDDEDAGLDALVDAGDVLVLEGGDREERTAVLLALTGRLTITDGRCKVAGLVLPTRAAGVRARTAVAVLDRDERPARAVLEAAVDGPAILAVDGADTLSDDGTRTEIRDILTEARTGAEARTGVPTTLVLTCATRHSVSDLVPPGADLHVVTLHRTAPVPDPAPSG